jgi:hypothetical protein
MTREQVRIATILALEISEAPPLWVKEPPPPPPPRTARGSEVSVVFRPRR